MGLNGLVQAPLQSGHQMAAALSRGGQTIIGSPRRSWAASRLAAEKLDVTHTIEARINITTQNELARLIKAPTPPWEAPCMRFTGEVCSAGFNQQSPTLSDQSLRELGDADRGETRRCSTRADGSYPARRHPPHSACLSVPPAKHRQEFEALCSMDGPKGEDRSAEQAASLFVAPELESQRRNTGRGNRWNNRKIIAGVRFSKIPTYTSLSEHLQ